MSDIEADEEYDVHEIKGSIERRNRILYQVKWLGFPRKKDWTYEPYENFSEAAREKIIEFQVRNPTAPVRTRVQGSRLSGELQVSWCVMEAED